MRIFCYLLLLFIIVINLGYPQCAGDVNLDNTVDGADVFIIVNHIFDTDTIEGDGFNNGDINGTTTIDIYDLVAIVNITLLPEDDCAGFLPIDLSLDWQIQEDPSYFDFETLDEIVNEEIAQLQYIRGIIVIHQGKIVSEQYFNNSSMDQVFNIWSVTKSYISTLIGQVIDEGLIPNQFVTLDSIFVQNSNTTQVTLENLLTMTSGWPENWSYMYIQNTLSFLLNTDFIWPPGSTWFYNNAANHLNSHVINEIASMPPKAYAMENLFPQLGINDPYWNEDQDGVNNGSYDLYLTLRGMVKLGQLYLQDGYSLNDQIISSEWITTATSNQANDWYGYLWWLPGIGYLALGLGGQYIVVVPELDLVIGTHSATESSGWYTDQLLGLIYNQIVPLFDLDQSLNNRGVNFENIIYD